MSKAPLAACPACARHVRVNEPSCPFCRTSLPEAFRGRPAPRPPPGRLSRAALYALGAAGTVSASIACGGNTRALYGGPPVDSGTGEKDSGAVVIDGGEPDSMGGALYGGPTFDSGEPDSMGGALYGGPTFDSGEPEDSAPPMFDAAYGGPTFDSGEPDSMSGALYGGPTFDGGEPDTMGGGPAYGGPPHDE